MRHSRTNKTPESDTTFSCQTKYRTSHLFIQIEKKNPNQPRNDPDLQFFRKLILSRWLITSETWTYEILRTCTARVYSPRAKDRCERGWRVVCRNATIRNAGQKNIWLFSWNPAIEGGENWSFTTAVGSYCILQIMLLKGWKCRAERVVCRTFRAFAESFTTKL